MAVLLAALGKTPGGHQLIVNSLLKGICVRKALLNSRLLSTSGSGTDAGDHGSTEFYDIVIAGGGLVGTSCAVALGRSQMFTDKRILLLETSKSFTTLESKKEGEDEPKFSNRVYAISPGSKSFMEKLGAWKHVWRSQEVLSMQVWDALSDANVTFANPGYSDPVAVVVESAVLSHAVEKQLQGVGNVTTEFGCSLQDCTFPSISNPEEKATVVLSNGKSISTDLVIGADGFKSRVRHLMGSAYLNGNYDRIAIVATLKLIEKTENNIAWQRFLPTGGPIALLPLSSEYSSLVWSTTPENAKQLMNLSEDDFVDEVNSALWKEYPRSTLVQRSCEFISSVQGRKPRLLPPSMSDIVPNSRATFPLGFGHSAYYVNRRVALIGDAAHRVHPLGGQGLNLGIGDVACLLKVLETSTSVGEHLGNLERLKHYETERQRHNVVVQTGVDFLHRLYSFDFSPVVAARSIGLSIVDSSDVLKKCIVAQASA
ncbi:unnamed protein product [Allacma fusca]|uniref:Ubiquinone biosynthesis monooxygenase COQ6, mitochondrial n=1 Tax=Allacma fusca TaxID=39272 RepID=A0A8J2PV46_9HEXA|nr:unnamed protein product [Allacma fusca]